MMHQKTADFMVHLDEIENIAADLEKLVESWKVDEANRAGKFSSVSADQLYNGQTKQRSTQMQLSFQSSQSGPRKTSAGLQKSVIKGTIQYNRPSASFNRLKWEAELEGCDDLSFRFEGQESQSSPVEIQESQQGSSISLEDSNSSTCTGSDRASQESLRDLSISLEDSTSRTCKGSGRERQESQQDLSITLEDNNSRTCTVSDWEKCQRDLSVSLEDINSRTCAASDWESPESQQDFSISLEDDNSSTCTGSGRASGYQTLEMAESQVNSQSSNEVEARGSGRASSYQKLELAESEVNSQSSNEAEGQGFGRASSYQKLELAESQVISQSSNEVETRDDEPVGRLQEGRSLSPNSLQFQQIQEHSLQEAEELLADESSIEDPPSLHRKIENGNFQKLEGLTQPDNSNIEEPHSLQQQFQDHNFQETKRLMQAENLNNEEHHTMHLQIQKHYFQEPKWLLQADELSSDELQIDLLERTINCELEIIESKMNIVKRKNCPEQLQREGGQSTSTPMLKDAKCEKTFMREQTRLENCRKKIHKLEMEMDGLIKERLDYMKRERQFELQKKILADAIHKVNSLQRQLSKKEEENIECLLREKEIKARLYEIEVYLKQSQALSSEYPFHLCLPRSSEKASRLRGNSCK